MDELSVLRFMVVVLFIGSAVGFAHCFSKISDLKSCIRTIKRNLTEYRDIANYKLNTRTGKIQLHLNDKATKEDMARALDYIVDEINDKS